MSERKTPQPRPHQVDALADLMQSLAVHDRTQLVMACGTGKTLVGRWHAQASDSQRILVLLPSLALVAQTIREWRRALGNYSTGWHFRALVVCSDPTTTTGLAERRSDLEDGAPPVTADTWDQISARVTTDPAHAARFLNQQKPGIASVVFSTYHSSPVVAQAQAAAGDDAEPFDLVICDEAHRLAGKPSPAFATVLDPRRIVARKRLFMTATPKAWNGEDGYSMSDPRLFGPVAHEVSFGEAIDGGLLADYQVLVVAGHGTARRPAADHDRTVPATLVKAIDDHGLQRVLTFHGRVAKARAFAEGMDNIRTPAGRPMRARHVSGTMKTDARIAALQWLGELGGSETRIVSNARCLSEGVDVPAVDGIMFADQRSSVVDIIQAVGRVLRPSPGKTRGTIILPVTLPDEGDDDSTLLNSAFTHVWTVLRGLRAHDQRLAEEVDGELHALVRGDRRHAPGGFRLPRISFVFPDDLDPTTITDLQVRLVQEVGSIWERNYALLETWAEHHNGKLMARGAKSLDGTISLGEWAEQQRIAHRHGRLPVDRADRLAKIPGWSWDKAESRWYATHQLLVAYAAEHGNVAEPPTGESRFAGMYDKEYPRRHLGIWMAAQRQAYRLGVLTADKVSALETLPGWRWDGGLPAGDVDMVEALRLFVEFEKHANVPDDHVEDGLRLGAWLWAIRRRRWTGHLAPALFDEIMAATPSKFRSTERFQWEKTETQWRIAYFALRQYTAREGSATPTASVQEQLPDTTVGLGQWCALQRLQHRRGELDAHHAELLAAMPGWRWEVDLRKTAPQPPVDLPPTSKHGGAGAYSNHKCRCAECLEWRRQADLDRLAKKRQHLDDPVPALRARNHLEQLERHLTDPNDSSSRNGRTLIAHVAGVGLGVLRKVMKGDATHIEREHETRILTVTPAMCAAARNQVGSRGRATSAATQRLEPGPTFELLDDLAGRGFGIHWVSKELGYAGGLQIRRDRRISARIHDAIADLHRRVGGLRMPNLPITTAKPSLAELLAEREGAGAA